MTFAPNHTYLTRQVLDPPRRRTCLPWTYWLDCICRFSRSRYHPQIAWSLSPFIAAAGPKWRCLVALRIYAWETGTNVFHGRTICCFVIVQSCFPWRGLVGCCDGWGRSTNCKSVAISRPLLPIRQSALDCSPASTYLAQKSLFAAPGLQKCVPEGE